MTTDRRADPSTDLADEGAGSSARRGGSHDGKRGKHLPLWQETILLLGIALVLAIVVKAFFVQAFYIPSVSMEPGLLVDDRILVQKVSYWGDGEPQRGDVVVFKDPGGWLTSGQVGPDGVLAQGLSKVGLYPTGGHLVKRVIGVAGDTIECCDEQGRLSVNGEPLDEEEYVQLVDGSTCNGPMVHRCEKDWKAGPVPEGRLFVMGDNRAKSADSSAHMEQAVGPAAYIPDDEFVPVDLVVGKVFVVLWPHDHFRWVQRPDVFQGGSAPGS